MSKKARAATKERRLRLKRARKAARRAQYETWKALGQNKKSKRARKQDKKAHRPKEKEWTLVPVFLKGRWRLMLRRFHRGGRCGNAGCKRCATYWQLLHLRLIQEEC